MERIVGEEQRGMDAGLSARKDVSGVARTIEANALVRRTMPTTVIHRCSSLQAGTWEQILIEQRVTQSGRLEFGVLNFCRSFMLLCRWKLLRQTVDGSRAQISERVLIGQRW